MITILKCVDEKIVDLIYKGIDDLQLESLETVIESVDLNQDLELIRLEKNAQGEQLVLVLEISKFYQKHLSKLSETTHEVRNLLAVVASSAMLLMKLNAKDKLHEKKETISKVLADVEVSIQNIIMVLNNLKQSAFAPKKTYRTIVKDFIHFVKSEATTLSKEHNVKLNIDVNVSEESYKKGLEVSGMMINQIVINLLKNSIYALNSANEENKSIDIEILEKSNKIFFEITDNGPGIDEKYHKKLFVKSFTTKGREGSGIGLNLCKENLMLSGGNIVFDRNYKDGAKFKFHLPLS
ncbi:MAG: HAMP domain-containing sensor histidine kinase [Bacteriovoracaceae bacterium]|nr:hypothetical protein [Halobacteriovoraceae bacterium]MDP7321118.1 HAMP domain-containing sensor histidine kinase [Bacteriovoracaceae bacterium]